MKGTRTKQEKKRKKIVILAVLIVAAAAVLCLWLSGMFAGRAAPRFVADDRAQDVGYENMDRRDILAGLQEQADKSNFSFKINSNPVFENAQSEGTLYIENPVANGYDMRVVITLDDTGKTVYESGMISPGQGIVRDTLDTPLEQGSYPATATIYAHDPDTKTEIGKAAAALEIKIGK